jgi:predicted transcriptional regulator
MEDNKKTISNYSENKLINSQFVKDDDLSFIIKKTEKVATAIYMISNFFNTEEPLKWELRKVVTKLLKNTMSFNDSSLAGKEIVISRVSGDFIELNTLFNLAYNSGSISQMNFEIVANEIDNLSKIVVAYYERQVSGTKALFKNDYFEVKKDVTNTQGSFVKDGRGAVLKDNVKDTIKDIKDTIKNKVVFNGKKSELEAFFKNAQSHTSNTDSERGTISDREQKILEKIKTSGPVTIKDISESFTDVSEKTIQRELQKMHDKGQIKKEGERRWTKYFI